MKYLKIIGAGLVATAAMTMFMVFAPYVGLPKMDIGTMLGTMLGDHVVLGWVMHFVMGAIFAFFYALIFNGWLPVINDSARGALYGIIVFVFSEMVFAIINLSGFFDGQMKASMAMMIFGHSLACFIYGAVLGTIMKREVLENGLDREKKNFF
jgi:uncharacterized membrane protein YagU involved in acid resistance